MYTNFLLLLRSLRACSLGVVLGKVAGNLYKYLEAAILQHSHLQYRMRVGT